MRIVGWLKKTSGRTLEYGGGGRWVAASFHLHISCLRPMMRAVSCRTVSLLPPPRPHGARPKTHRPGGLRHLDPGGEDGGVRDGKKERKKDRRT